MTQRKEINTFIPSDKCPKCEGTLTYELVNVITNGDQCEPDAALYCEHCALDLEIDWDSYRVDNDTFWRITPNQKRKIDKMIMGLDASIPIPTQNDALDWKDFFTGLPCDDFNFTQEDMWDWIPYYDNRSEARWMKYCDAYNVGRTNGLAWIERIECDMDGNWDSCWKLIEDSPGVEPEAYKEYLIDMHPNWMIRGWCEYAHWVADNGVDPLQEYADLSPENIIKSLESLMG